jgi:hypothetical protein
MAPAERPEEPFPPPELMDSIPVKPDELVSVLWANTRPLNPTVDNIESIVIRSLMAFIVFFRLGLFDACDSSLETLNHSNELSDRLPLLD